MEHERNYPTHDLELAVSVFTLETWQHYEHGEKCKYTLTKEPQVPGHADGMEYMAMKMVGIDKDIEILYHNTNVVTDAWSRKTVHTSAMITKQGKLQDEMKNTKIKVATRGGTALIAQMTVQPAV